MKKQQLEVELDLDFLLFGFISNQKSSKLGFFLNQTEFLNLERVADLKLPDYNPQANTSFSKFAFLDEENRIEFSLIANKEFGYQLFPDLKQFDFIMVIRGGGIEFFDIPNFLAACRKIPGIQLLAEIQQEKIKSLISGIV